MPKLTLNELVFCKNQHDGCNGKVIDIKKSGNREIYIIEQENGAIKNVPDFTVLTDILLGWVGVYKLQCHHPVTQW